MTALAELFVAPPTVDRAQLTLVPLEDVPPRDVVTCATPAGPVEVEVLYPSGALVSAARARARLAVEQGWDVDEVQVLDVRELA